MHPICALRLALLLCGLASVGNGAPNVGGQVSFYKPTEMGKPGACGQQNQDTEPVAAIAHDYFDTYPGHSANPNNNPLCHKKIKVTYQSKSVIATIADRCGDCNITTSVDLTPVLFEQLAPVAGKAIRDFLGLC
ncbi:plant expansin [Mycena crocata]|nr:plant expansin [Mycena crocata]